MFENSLLMQVLAALGAVYLLYRYRQLESKFNGSAPSPLPELVAGVSDDYKMLPAQAEALQGFMNRLSAEGFTPAFLVAFQNSLIPHHVILLSEDRGTWAEVIGDGSAVSPLVILYTIFEDGYCLITTCPYGTSEDAPMLMARNAYDLSVAVQHHLAQVEVKKPMHGLPHVVTDFASFARIYDIFRTQHLVNLHRKNSRRVRNHRHRTVLALVCMGIVAMVSIIAQVAGSSSAQNYGAILWVASLLILALLYNINGRLDRLALIGTAIDAEVSKPPLLWQPVTASKNKG